MMDNFMYLDDFKLQVHKIVELLNSYTITQRVEAFNYFFSNINFVFPLFSNENCLIEPNLKISLFLLPTSSSSSNKSETNCTKCDELSTPSEPRIKQERDDKNLVSVNNSYRNLKGLKGSFLYSRFRRDKKPIIFNSYNLLNISRSTLFETRTLIHNYKENNLKFIFNANIFKNLLIQYTESNSSNKRILSRPEPYISTYEEVAIPSPKRIKCEKEDSINSDDSDRFDYEISEEIAIGEEIEPKNSNKLTAESCDDQEVERIAKTFNCLQCGKIYRKKNSLLTHSYHHHPGWCPTCGKYYGTNAKDLGDHNRKYHIKEYPHICDECGESFKRRQQYLVHIEVHKRKKLKDLSVADGEKRKSFKCSICNLEFKGFKCYEKHIQEGHKLEGFICEHCGARFKEKLSLHQHNFKVHRKELPCPHCDKTFSYKSNLDRHIVLHTEAKKSYICELCGASYYTPMSLKEHFAYAHKEVKEFVCETCNKAFTAKRAWQRHQIVHSDERPFNCNLCSRTFKIKSNLVRHKHLTHKQVPQTNKLKRFIKNEKGDLVPVEENLEPPNEKIKSNTSATVATIKSSHQNQTYASQQQQLGSQNESMLDEGNFMHIMNNNMQYPIEECANNQNIEIIQIDQNYNAYTNNQINNNISTMILQGNHPNQNHDDFGNSYNQSNYNLQEEWNNVETHNQIGEYSLVEVNSESLMSLHMKSTNRHDNQMMDMANVELLHYPDIWNTNGNTNISNANIEYTTTTNMDSSHHHHSQPQQHHHHHHHHQQQQANSYNIGSILTNLELMDNQNNINEINLNIQNSTGSMAPPQLNYNDHHQHHHHHHHGGGDHQLDQSHLNYDFNSQNHTITDISNTFIKETDDRASNENAGGPSEDVNSCNKNNNMMMAGSTSNDIIDSIGLNSKQIKEMLQNTNENVMLPSLIDYLQHPYQF